MSDESYGSAVEPDLAIQTNGSRNGETRSGDRAETPSIVRVLMASGTARLIVLPITGISTLVIARLITGSVGIEQFGAVMLIATLGQLLMFADLGAGAAVASATAQMDGSSEQLEHFRRTLLTAIRTVFWSAAVLAVGAVTVGLFADWPSLLGIRPPENEGIPSANLATVIALVVFCVSLPFALGEAVQRGAGRLHHAVLLTGLAAPTALTFTLILRSLGAPTFAYALVMPFGALLGTACCAIGARRTLRSTLAGLSRQVFHPRRFRGLPILGTAGPMFIVMVGLPLALQTDRIIIAHRVDAASLSDYTYAVQLYTPLWSVVSVAALGLWPLFAAKGTEIASMRQSWRKAVTLLGGVGLSFAAAFLLLAGIIIGWMSGGSATPEFGLILSFAALLAVQAAHVGTGIMLISPKHLRFQAICVIALVLTNVPLSWLLAPVLGATGPVVASVITVAVCQLLPGVLVARRATSTSLVLARNAAGKVPA